MLEMHEEQERVGNKRSAKWKPIRQMQILLNFLQ